MNLDLNTLLNTAISNAIETALTKLLAPLAENLHAFESRLANYEMRGYGNEVNTRLQDLENRIELLRHGLGSAPAAPDLTSIEARVSRLHNLLNMVIEAGDEVDVTSGEVTLATPMHDAVFALAKDAADELVTTHEDDNHDDDDELYGTRFANGVRDVVREMDFTIRVGY